MRALLRLITTLLLIIAILWTETQLRRLKSPGSLWPWGPHNGPPAVLYDSPKNEQGFTQPDPNTTAPYLPSEAQPSTKRQKRPALVDLVPNQFNLDKPIQTGAPGDDYTTDPETETEPEPEPEPTPVDGVIVVGKLKEEDTDWIVDELPEWQNAIYTVNDPSSSLLTTPQNKGREGNVYLYHLITHYDTLPATIVFLHAHRSGFPVAWHNEFHDYNNVRSLKNLQIDFVQANGYANLRCQLSPGCPDEVRPFRADPGRPTEVAFVEAWRDLFNNTEPVLSTPGAETEMATGEVPEVVGVACCAQFAVSREQVWKRPVEDYVWFHRWLMETELRDDVSGRVMEYLWHVIFGRGAIYCPDVAQCYQDVYGMSIFDDWIM